MSYFLVDQTRYVATPASSSSGVLSGVSQDVEMALACRNCRSASLLTDWKAGDVICTDCGVVAESHIRDMTAEWRDYQDDGCMPSLQRCGMVANDETRFVGGLEPTMVASQPFGGPLLSGKANTGTSQTPKTTESYTSSLMVKPASMTQQLRNVHRKIDWILEKSQKQDLKETELARKVMAKRRANNNNNNNNNEEDGDDSPNMGSILESLRPDRELEIKLQESSTTAASIDKWSLDHALLLFNTDQERHQDLPPRLQRELEQRREDLRQRLSPTEKQASKDLFLAYSMLQSACQALALASTVEQECIQIMTQYASKVNGFHVKGATSRTLIQGTSTTDPKAKTKQLQMHNKIRQIGALNAAILYTVSRRSGHGRSLLKLCQAVEETCRKQVHVSPLTKDLIVKPKACSKAMEQLKLHFPSLVEAPSPQATTSSETQPLDHPAATAANLVPHLAKTLSLPHDAHLMIQAVALQLGQDQLTLGTSAGTKPSVLCAAATVLVCTAGSLMRKLAEQALSRAKAKSQAVSTKSKEGTKSKERKRPAAQSFKTLLESNEKRRKVGEIQSQSKPDDLYDSLLPDPVLSNSNIAADDQETKILQEWNEWLQQSDWKRTFGEISRASGVTVPILFAFYKPYLYERRSAMLMVANEALVADRRIHSASSAMLRNIASAAPLMTIEKPSG